MKKPLNLTILDPKDPFFAKPLRRWLTAGFPLVWSLWEFSRGNTGWGAFFLLLGGYATWVLLINFPKNASETDAAAAQETQDD